MSQNTVADVQFTAPGHGEPKHAGGNDGNLVALIEQWLGSNEVATRLGSLVGLSPESTRTAIRAAVPAILAALVGLVQRPAGRDQVAAAVRNQDPGVLDTLSACWAVAGRTL